MNFFYSLIDSFMEARTREIARRTDRRNFLGRFGLLPIDSKIVQVTGVNNSAVTHA